MAAVVESIEKSGDEGMYLATVEIDGHGGCLTVIGTNLTECVIRLNKIIQAFNRKGEL
jgi:hypothetical protein